LKFRGAGSIGISRVWTVNGLSAPLAELGGFGQGVEGGDGFDQAGDGEGVEDAAGFTDEMKHATFAAEGDRHADECRDAGAIDLRYPVEIDNDLARSVLENSGQRSGELVTGIADGEAAVNVKNVYAVLFADVNFNGSVLGHFYLRVCKTSCISRACKYKP
jgi:hypothetical protein